MKNSVLTMYKGEVALAYATGRSFKSTWERKDSDYQKMICKDWDRDMVIHQASKIPGLVLQEDEFQSPMKASYYLTDSIKIMEKPAR